MAWTRTFPLLLLAGWSLIGSGCLFIAAGAAGAGAATYFYVRGRLCQEYHSSFADTWQAVHTAFKEQGFPVTHQENNGSEGSVSSKTADNYAISVHITTQPSRIPAEKNVTRVCVRVGTWGDEPLSERILNQISSHLVPAGLQPRTPGVPTAKTSTDNGVQPAGWTAPRETTPPPELPSAPVPIRR